MSIDKDKPMTSDQWRQLLAHQYSTCALCGKGGHLEIDHDHRTELIRGLLCRDCNHNLDEYEKKRRIYRNMESYLNDPPMRALGLEVKYKSPVRKVS